jgi:hypothetical protein
VVARHPEARTGGARPDDAPLVRYHTGAGVGLVQALCCDIRFAADEARISCAFTRRGTPAEYGVSWLLPRLIGLADATDRLTISELTAVLSPLGAGTLVADEEHAAFGRELAARAGLPKPVRFRMDRLGMRARVYADLLELRPGDVYSSSRSSITSAASGC